MTSAEPVRVVELRPRRSRARAAIVSLRPRQWSKNLLLFAGIVFAAKLGDAVRWGEATAIFVAYCAASSAAYLVNDLRDAEDDRQHPVKRFDQGNVVMTPTRKRGSLLFSSLVTL